MVITGTQNLIDQVTVTGKRSEEHTSELQSRPHLVCRLLLEKKKKQSSQASITALQEEIRAKSVPALLDFIVAHLQKTNQLRAAPLRIQVVMQRMQPEWCLNN